MTLSAELAARAADFWARALEEDEEIPDDCWYWKLACDRDGYGKFLHAGNKILAHRVAWMIPPDGGSVTPLEQVERMAEDAACYRGLTAAAAAVLAERRRQIEAEGWTPEHDDEHCDGAMAKAAAAYALHDLGAVPSARVDGMVGQLWPWDDAWWKPRDCRSNLVRAAALLIAEIERLDRAAP